MEGGSHIHNRILRFTLTALYLTHAFSFPAPDLIQGSHQMRENHLQGSSRTRQQSVLSIHFYHEQSSFLAIQILLFHSTLFLHRPSIPFIAAFSNSHLSYRIILFSSHTHTHTHTHRYIYIYIYIFFFIYLFFFFPPHPMAPPPPQPDAENTNQFYHTTCPPRTYMTKQQQGKY